MDLTTDPTNDPLLLEDNSTDLQSGQIINIDPLLTRLRSFYVEEYYGDYYRTIFAVTCVVCSIGFVTNFLNLLVFSRTKLSNSMNLFLMLLAVSDLVLITSAFAHIIHYYCGFKLYPFYGYYLFYVIGFFIESVSDNVSNWFVTTVAVWRYIAVTWPQRCARWFSRRNVIIIISVIIIFSFLLAFPVFLIVTYKTVPYEGYVFYDRVFTEFAQRNDHLHLKIYWGFLLLRGLVPMIIMAVSTIGLVWSLCRSNYGVEKDSASYRINLKITIMLIVLAVLFLLSNLPDSFLMMGTVVTGGDSDFQQSYRSATDIIRVFMLTNNSLSFFIYYGLGYEFKTEFNKLFCRARGRKDDNASVVESSVGNAELDNPCGGTKDTSHAMKGVVETHLTE